MLYFDLLKLKKTWKKGFMEQKGRTETLMESVDLLNEQINNDYLENEADEEVVES